jgi:hypothetical protein
MQASNQNPGFERRFYVFKILTNRINQPSMPGTIERNNY